MANTAGNPAVPQCRISTTLGLTGQQIARLLGYSNPGSFTHAYKRWTEISPEAPQLPLLGYCRGELSEQIPASGHVLREQGGTGCMSDGNIERVAGPGGLKCGRGLNPEYEAAHYP